VPGTSRRTYALDRIAFSYAPSARALAHARQAASAAPGERLFAVDNPDGSLRHSRQEVDGVARHFAEPWLARRDHATRNTALHALPRCDVYHFSCHGNNNWNAPLESALWMHGNLEPVPLTVRDLLGAAGAQARLAFLSACETGLVAPTCPTRWWDWRRAFCRLGRLASSPPSGRSTTPAPDCWPPASTKTGRGKEWNRRRHWWRRNVGCATKPAAANGPTPTIGPGSR